MDPIIDFHAHFQNDFARLQQEAGIVTCFSAGTPGEWERLYRFLQVQEETLPGRCSFGSFGIHPWHAKEYNPADWMAYYRDCALIGEIGMDSVWCEVPLDIQRRRLEQQLQIAADLHKPIILHTKGQEAEIGRMIRDFPEPVCVHWYSGEHKNLDDFLKKDCYFTLGPDCGTNPERYRYLVHTVCLQRLFLETDGADAVAWALGQEKFPVEKIPALLEKNLEWLALESAEVSESRIRKIMWENKERFFGKSDREKVIE